MMMQSSLQTSSTPFKIIHDENEFSGISTKTGKNKALKSSIKPPIGGKVSFENSTPLGLGKGSKQLTQRKALSNLSTSQVNARLNTPGTGFTTKPGLQISIYSENPTKPTAEIKKKSSISTAVTDSLNHCIEKGYVPSEVQS